MMEERATRENERAGRERESARADAAIDEVHAATETRRIEREALRSDCLLYTSPSPRD